MITDVLKQEHEDAGQQYTQVRAELGKVIERLARDAPPRQFKTVEELLAWIDEPESDQNNDQLVRRRDLQRHWLTVLC
jgi:hypothetical protein